MVTPYEKFSSKLLTFTIISLLAAAIVIYGAVLYLGLTTPSAFAEFVAAILPLGSLLYLIYKFLHRFPFGKYMLSAYSFVLCFIIMSFVESGNSSLVVFLVSMLTLIYLDRLVTLLASGYGLIVLGIHQMFNPYLQDSTALDRIVLFSLFMMCCITCVSVCVIGRRSISRAQISEKQALENEHRFRQIFEFSPEANIVQVDNRIVHVNKSALTMIGARLREDIVGRVISDFISLEDFERSVANMSALRANAQTASSAELRIHTMSGGVIEVEATSILTHFNGSPAILSNFRDITESKKAQQTIQYLAYYDQLTNLPNRHHFMKRLAETLKSAENDQSRFGVMFLDLDRFKMINDSYGHHVGDSLLLSFATRLQSQMDDTVFAARFAGDEFVAILPAASHETAEALSVRLLEQLMLPFRIKGEEIMVTSSIGIAMFPQDGLDAETLIINADTAMYAAKDRGRNQFDFYCNRMSEVNNRKNILEQELRKALGHGELQIVFQSKEDVRAGRINGFEALLRWHHPKLGTISPTEFIPLAEETGLIVSIGEWVLRGVCEQIRDWKRSGLAPLPVSVNLSVRQFKQENLIEMLQSCLNEFAIEPGLIELEITESVASSNYESQLIHKLHEIKKLGVKISIDDFGTGYSSLNYLRQFPVDTLKIDRSFIQNIEACADDLSIVTAIIGMAHSLKLTVLAEGVENQAQLDLLKQHHCDGVQGYLFGHPLPADRIAPLLPKTYGAELELFG